MKILEKSLTIYFVLLFVAMLAIGLLMILYGADFTGNFTLTAPTFTEEDIILRLGGLAIVILLPFCIKKKAVMDWSCKANYT